MVVIKNDQQLKAVLIEIIREVIESVSVDVRERLVRYIQEATYRNDYFPNYVYEGGNGSAGSGEPSYEFEQAWRWKGSKTTLNTVSNELYYAWQNMTIDRKTGRHWDGTDTRKKLAEMMNVHGIVGRKEREPYWDLFLEEMDKEIDKKFLVALRAKGLRVIG